MISEYLKQSWHLSEAGLVREALSPIHIGLGIHPNSPELWYEKYRLLRRLNDPEAYKALMECRRIAPNYLPALQSHYEELVRVHRLKEAYQLLQELLQKDEMNPRWWAHKAFWAMYFGDLEAAEEAIQKVSELPTQSPEILYYQALFLARLGREKEASELLEKCVKQEPQLLRDIAEEPVLQALMASSK